MPEDGSVLVSIHKALLGFDKRAERISDEILEATFVDSAPLFDLLSSRNNQIVYGRRGTGKTHALRFLSSKVERKGDRPVYIDLRSVGSNGSIYGDESRSLSERALTLIVDVLNALQSELYNLALVALEEGADAQQVTIRIDDFSAAISSVKVTGSAEEERRYSAAAERSATASAEFGAGRENSAKASVGATGSVRAEEAGTFRRAGVEKIYVNFGSIGSALSGLLTVLDARIWLLVDEWSEVPLDLQPYLADLFRRTVLPLNDITLKIAAIEHRSNFAIRKDNGEYVGLELGADVAADLNLDDFLVFDNSQEESTAFFKALMYRHFQSSENAVRSIDSADRLIQVAFTQINVFEEFVRAVEGVPRDALNLAAKVATKAYGNKISMQHVREAARDWYQQDKQAVIRSNVNLNQLLMKIVDDIIGNRRARAFLFPANIRYRPIDQLFDSRLLHILKKNISSRDQPGSRFDVYKIDYGCYVDLINTAKFPESLFKVEGDGGGVELVEVPRDDYRSIRRAILTPDDFEDSSA